MMCRRGKYHADAHGMPLLLMSELNIEYWFAYWTTMVNNTVQVLSNASGYLVLI